MDPAPLPPRKPSRFRRWRRIILLLVVVVPVLAWFGRAIWLPWLLAPVLRAQLADLLAADVSIERLETDGTSHLLLVGLRCEPRDESRLTGVTRIDHLAVSGDVFALFGDRPPVDRVELRGLHLALAGGDDDEAADPGRHPASPESVLRSLRVLDWLRLAPSVTADDVTVTIDAVRIDCPQLRIERQGDQLAIALAGGIDLPAFALHGLELNGTIDIRDLQRGQLAATQLGWRHPQARQVPGIARHLRWQLLAALLPRLAITAERMRIVAATVENFALRSQPQQGGDPLRGGLAIQAGGLQIAGSPIRAGAMSLDLAYDLERSWSQSDPQRFAEQEAAAGDSLLAVYRRLLAQVPLLELTPTLAVAVEDGDLGGLAWQRAAVAIAPSADGTRIDCSLVTVPPTSEDRAQEHALSLAVDRSSLRVVSHQSSLGDGGMALSGGINLPLGDGHWALSVSQVAPQAGLSVDGRLSLAIDTAGQLQLGLRDATVADEQQRWLQHTATLQRLDLVADLAQDDVLHRPLRRLRVHDLDLALTGVLPSAPGPSPTEPPQPLAAQVTALLERFALVQRLPDIDIDRVDLRWASTVAVDDLELRLQPASDAEGDGRLRAKARRLELDGRVFVDGRLDLTIAPDGLVLGSAQRAGLTAGGSGGQVAVWARIDRGGEPRLTARVTLTDALILDGKNRGETRLRIDADLEAEGVIGRQVTVGGRVEVASALYHAEFAGGGAGGPDLRGEEAGGNPIDAIGIELPIAPGGGYPIPGVAGLDWLQVDLAVTTRHQALLQNALLALLLDARMRVHGNGAALAVSGEINGELGEVRILPGTFVRLKRLDVQIPRSPGQGPVVDCIGSITIGRLVIDVQIAGPLANPSVTLSSNATEGYTQDDLLSLLVFGRLPGDSSQSTNDQRDFLAAQALRVVSMYTFDRPPELYPSTNVLTGGWAFELGSREERLEDELPFAMHDTTTDIAFAVEKVLSERWSVISRVDQDNNPSADIQFRQVFGGQASINSGIELPAMPAYLDQVLYEGNKRQSASRLNLELARPLLGPAQMDWSAARCDDAAFRLRMRYRHLGFTGTTVTWAFTETGQVRFTIDEGHQLTQSGLVVHWLNAAGEEVEAPLNPLAGNGRLDTQLLEEVAFAKRIGLRVTINRRVMAAQGESLENYLHSIGYRQAVVVGSEMLPAAGQTRQVVHRIVAGPLFHLRSLTWEPASAAALLPADLLERAAALVDRPCGVGTGAAVAAEAQAALRRSAYLRARCEPRITIDAEAGSVAVVIEIDPGPRHVAGRVRLQGLERVDGGFIERVVDLEPGEALGSERMRRLQRRLLGTGLFRSVLLAERDDQDGQDPPGPLPEHVSDIDITLRERQPYELRLRLGYGTVDQMRLGADLIWRSPFGRAESLSLGGEFNERLQRIDATLAMPYLFAQPWLTGRITPFWQRASEHAPRYDEELFGAVSMLDMQLNRQIRFGLGIVNAVVTDRLTDTDDKINTPFVETAIDLRDSPFIANLGLRAYVRHESTGRALGSTLTYDKTRVNVAAYLPLGSRLTMAVGSEYGSITTSAGTSGDDLPTSFRFTAGGAFSVRGFHEQSLGPRDPLTGEITGGELLAVLRAELRLRFINDSLQFVAFSDWGNVFREGTSFGYDDLRQGIGAGARFITPAGAIMFDVGYNVDREPGEDEWVPHLSFGMPF